MTIKQASDTSGSGNPSTRFRCAAGFVSSMAWEPSEHLKQWCGPKVSRITIPQFDPNPRPPRHFSSTGPTPDYQTQASSCAMVKPNGSPSITFCP